QDRYTPHGLSLWGRANFDPLTMTAATGLTAAQAGSAALTGGGMLASLFGTGVSSQGQLAAGDYAEQAGRLARQAKEYEATQLEQNAKTVTGIAARSAAERKQTAAYAVGRSRAVAAASGGDAGVGNAVENEGALVARGEYQALSEMFKGENEATGLRNRAAA